MVDFKNVAGSDYVPHTDGLTLGVGPVPARVTATHIGNFGTGNPVGQLEVQRIAGGDWLPVSGATITDNGTVSANVYGVAVRWSVPALTSPGTTTTAPRVALTAQPLGQPNATFPIITTSNHSYDAAAGSTENLPSDAGVIGFGSINPNIGAGPMVMSKSLAFVSQVGEGDSFIEGLYRDGDGDFWIAESATLGTDGQVCVESYADAYRVNFTDGTGTTDVWLDVFQVPV